MRPRVALALALLLVAAGVLWWLVAEAAMELGGPTPEANPVTRPTRAAPRGSRNDDELAVAPTGQLGARGPQPGDGGSTGEAADASATDAQTERLADELRTDMAKAFLRTNAAAAEKYVDRYCAETKQVGALPAFSQPPRTHDAAVFMSGRSDYEGGHVGLLHLPASLTDRMGNPPLNWRNFGPADYAGLDFGWMHQLLEFDHWSLTAEGPLKNVDALDYQTNIPNFVPLQQWVKLRLVKGRLEGDLPQASLEARHLADLCASTGTLIGEMIRNAMYNIERDYMVSLGQPPSTPLPSADEVLRVRQSAFAGMYFLYPGVSRAVKEKALKCIPTRCAALNEGILATAAFRDLNPSTDEDLAWLQSQSPCDPEQARRLARAAPLSPKKLMENYELSSATPGVEPWMNRLLDGGL